MIFFRVTQNINIKTTDGTLVNYHRFKTPSNLENDTVYITSENDFNDLKNVFRNVDKNKYQIKLLKENKIRELESFPIELGISNKNEYLKSLDFKKNTEKKLTINKNEILSLFDESNKVDIFTQLIKTIGDEISIAIIGGVGRNISEIVSSCTALRILNNKLKEMILSVIRLHNKKLGIFCILMEKNNLLPLIPKQ